MLRKYGKIERLRQESKATSKVRDVAKRFSGNEREKAEQIAKRVISHTLFTSESTLRKRFHSANRILTRKKAYNDNVCIDRCNLAIGLLNAAGIKSWLARQVVFEMHGVSSGLRVHDFVESIIDGKIHTVYFGRNLDLDYYGIHAGPAEEFLGEGTILRGIDSSHVGGIKDLQTLKSFTEKANRKDFFGIEKVENAKRIDFMVEHGLIPEEIGKQLKKK